jgi:hypothetical protein
MKALKVATIIFVTGALLWGQSAPNLENGFKSFGSYQSGNLDTVNLQTGNLVIPVPVFSYPQRGSVKVSNALYISSNDWQAVCTNPPNRGQVCNWRKRVANKIALATPGIGQSK